MLTTTPLKRARTGAVVLIVVGLGRAMMPAVAQASPPPVRGSSLELDSHPCPVFEEFKVAIKRSSFDASGRFTHAARSESGNCQITLTVGEPGPGSDEAHTHAYSGTPASMGSGTSLDSIWLTSNRSGSALRPEWPQCSGTTRSGGEARCRRNLSTVGY